MCNDASQKSLFRQYKREQKVKSRVTVVSSSSSQQGAEDPCSPSPSSSSDLGSLGSTSLSSEDNRDGIEFIFTNIGWFSIWYQFVTFNWELRAIYMKFEIELGTLKM